MTRIGRYSLGGFLFGLFVLINTQIPPNGKSMDLILINLNHTILLILKDFLSCLNIFLCKNCVSIAHFNGDRFDNLFNFARHTKETRMICHSGIDVGSSMGKQDSITTSPTETNCPDFLVLRLRSNVAQEFLDTWQDYCFRMYDEEGTDGSIGSGEIRCFFNLGFLFFLLFCRDESRQNALRNGVV